MKNTISFLLFGLAVVCCSPVDAGSATWNQNPTSSLWNTPENWSPATVPNNEADIATFGASNITDVIVGDSTDFAGAENKVSEIIFTPDAGAYTLISAPSSETAYSDLIEFYGAGIVNNSGKVQNLIVGGAPGLPYQQSAVIYFQNSSSAGEDVVITNQGSSSSMGVGAYGGGTNFGFDFADTASAGKATIINEGGKVAGTVEGGNTDLVNYSTAEAATFINQPGEVNGAAAGSTYVYTGGDVGTSTFMNNGATVAGAEGGWTELDYAICAGGSFIANGTTSAGAQGGQVYTYGGAGYATFTAKGGEGSGAQGGLLAINNIPDSAQTVVTAEAGSDGGLGGMISIEGLPVSLDQVQFQMAGNATMDLSNLRQKAVAIGSLSGAGTVSLDRFTLTIGSNDLDATFSGALQGSGKVAKSGTGQLTLSGANSYSGDTSIAAGTLVVANQSGSATGTGAVRVSAGTLGGNGTIAGAVTVGTGSGAGAKLAPGVGEAAPATLVIQRGLIFKSDATYSYRLQAKGSRFRSDEVVAKGVKIESGAQFSFQRQVRGKIAAGAVFSVINNTAATSISGAFANLPDGTTFKLNGNKLQASYEGGDGNDLTLTVVP